MAAVGLFGRQQLLVVRHQADKVFEIFCQTDGSLLAKVNGVAAALKGLPKNPSPAFFPRMAHFLQNKSLFFWDGIQLTVLPKLDGGGACASALDDPDLLSIEKTDSALSKIEDLKSGLKDENRVEIVTAELLLMTFREIPKNPLYAVFELISLNKAAVEFSTKTKMDLALALHSYVDLAVVYGPLKDKAMVNICRLLLEETIAGIKIEEEETHLRLYLESAMEGLTFFEQLEPSLLKLCRSAKRAIRDDNLNQLPIYQVLNPLQIEMVIGNPSWYAKGLIARMLEDKIINAVAFHAFVNVINIKPDWHTIMFSLKTLGSVLESSAPEEVKAEALELLILYLNIEGSLGRNSWQVRLRAATLLTYVRNGLLPFKDIIDTVLKERKEVEKDSRVMAAFMAFSMLKIYE